MKGRDGWQAGSGNWASGAVTAKAEADANKRSKIFGMIYNQEAG
jgi:hypothetical protein